MENNEKLIKETHDGYKIWENDITLEVDKSVKSLFSSKNIIPNFRCYLMQFPPGNKEYVLYSFNRIPIFSSKDIEEVKNKIQEIFSQIV
jgi:hypothetical protein